MLLFLLSFPVFCWADTLDFWTVYYNDSIIGRFNSNSTLDELILKSGKIKKNDSIFIVYGNDHPCINCEYYFSVKDKDNGVKIYVKRERKLYVMVGFPLDKLNRYKHDNEFVFFLHEDNFENKHNNVYIDLFHLKIE